MPLVVQAIYEAYEHKLLEQGDKTDTGLKTQENDDLDKLLEAIGLKRNFYVIDLRKRFTLALTSGAVNIWGCLVHEPWKDFGNLTGSVD